MRVKPAAGRKVRDPKTMKFIPEEGIELKQLSTYWTKRLQDGDVLEVNDAPSSSGQEKKPAAAQASAKPGNGGGK
jgi:hypothetical protein